jgi:pyrroline-5-carboxylate reductase
LGTPLELPEKLMPAVTGVSGSGIAYVFAFLHGLALGGAKAGMPYDTSLDAALTTLEGAVAALRNRQEHPVALLSKVASPAGTTIEGIHVLEERGFTAAVMDAVVAAARRAQEMERA